MTTPTGSPMRYSRRIADEICRRLIDGESLTRICGEVGMPSNTTVRLWARADYDGFGGRYRRVMAIRERRLAERGVEAAPAATAP